MSMSTQAQIEANKQNAKKSTGPKTSEGRSNSTLHGLTANPTTIFENNPHEQSQYDALKAEFGTDLATA